MRQRHLVRSLRRHRPLSAAIVVVAVALISSLFFLFVPSVKKTGIGWRIFTATNGNTDRVAEKQLQSTRKAFRLQNFGEIQNSDGNNSSVLLTLFTSFRYSHRRKLVHRRTVKNWSSLRPNVRPVLYAEDQPRGEESSNDEIEILDFARQLGWTVLTCNGTSSTKVPVLRWLFTDATTRFRSEFYGFANADILFDGGLIETLKTLIGRFRKFLMIGTRVDCHVATDCSFDDRRTREPVLKNAQDYFVTTRTGFDWESVPDFVIGRAGYDNWLVTRAMVGGIPVVDTSATVTALHQMVDGDDHSTHFVQVNNDSKVNYVLAGKRFDYSLGVTECAQLETRNEGEDEHSSSSSSIVLRWRKPSRYCRRNFIKQRLRPTSFHRELFSSIPNSDHLLLAAT